MSLLTGVKNRMRPASVAWLTFMWVLLMGEVSWGNVAAGLALGVVIVLALPLPRVPRSGNRIHWPRPVSYTHLTLPTTPYV